MNRRPLSRAFSTAPPPGGVGASRVVVADGTQPSTVGSRWGAYLRLLLSSRRYVWALAIGGGGGFLAGAVIGDLLIATLAPVVFAALVVATAAHAARRMAAADFFESFARTHGLAYDGTVELVEATPLLGAGDRRRCEHYMVGDLGAKVPGARVGMAHYTYEVSSERTDRRGRKIEAWTPYRFTICVVELQRAIRSFPGVFLSRRRGLLGRISGDTWLNYDSMREVELESTTISDRYELWVRRNQDNVRLLELFRPSFQVWLGELPFELCFEYSGGTLVTYVHKHLGDAVSLEMLLQATASVAEQILREGEPRRPEAEPASVAPPAGAPTLRANGGGSTTTAGRPPSVAGATEPPGPSPAPPAQPPSAAG